MFEVLRAAEDRLLFWRTSIIDRVELVDEERRHCRAAAGFIRQLEGFLLAGASYDRGLVLLVEVEKQAMWFVRARLVEEVAVRPAMGVAGRRNTKVFNGRAIAPELV